jgi:outer membrane lipoprotein-sorting protein
MNRLLILLTIALLGVSAGVAQTTDPNQEAKLLALIKDVQAQEAQMVDNQKQIESKLAEIQEALRVARIYAGRSL